MGVNEDTSVPYVEEVSMTKRRKKIKGKKFYRGTTEPYRSKSAAEAKAKAISAKYPAKAGYVVDVIKVKEYPYTVL